MHLTYRNVNSAFRGLVEGIHTGAIPTSTLPSRNGEVLQVEQPVIVTYERPLERVLFNQARDCNVFFHLYEALWMLAGRNDVASLSYYNSQIANYSDDGQTFNGAYGYRWRNATAHYPDAPDYGAEDWVDQLGILIKHLKANPYSRRAVLTMWNTEDDLLKIDSSRDVCCNLTACFSVEQGPCPECAGTGLNHPEAARYRNTDDDRCPKCHGTPAEQPRYLNMTVFNRSNDLVWGMLGANVVHFSFLQEYMAACLGLEVGRYHQITNNCHAYADKWEPLRWLAEYQRLFLCKAKCFDEEKHYVMSHSNRGPCAQCGATDGEGVTPFVRVEPLQSYPSGHVPLVQDPAVFDRECAAFVNKVDGVWQEPFLRFVAMPMCQAFRHHKNREYEQALAAIADVKADDWRIAGFNWITKRKAMWERRHEKREADTV